MNVARICPISCDVTSFCETLHLCLWVAVRHLNLKNWIKSVCAMGGFTPHRRVNDLVEEVLGRCRRWLWWRRREQRNRASFTYMAGRQVNKVELWVIFGWRHDVHAVSWATVGPLSLTDTWLTARRQDVVFPPVSSLSLLSFVAPATVWTQHTAAEGHL